MFESGVGGDFATYVGAASGSIYRLDLAKLHYQGISAASLLAVAEKKEGRLSRVPEEITCKICGTIFSARSIPVEGEEIVEAYEL
jgi:hypothetical protein